MSNNEKISEFFSFWENVRKSFYNILSYIHDDDLGYRPDDKVKRLGQILTHIPSAYHWWLEYIVKDGKNIEPPKESLRSIAEIRELFESAHRRLEEFMSDLTWDDLKKEYEVKEGEEIKKVSLLWIFWHLAEHDIHHRAQVKLYCTLKGIEIKEQDFWNQPVL